MAAIFRDAATLRELRRKTTNQVRDFVGDLGFFGRFLVADERVDGQVILDQPQTDYAEINYAEIKTFAKRPFLR